MMTRKLLVCLFVAVLIFLTQSTDKITSVAAEQKLIEAIGYAIMGDGPQENPAVAQERARNDAKRAACEKAGVYVESIVEVKDSILSKDEIRTISANILKVQSDPVTAEVIEGTAAIKYICRITALVDTGQVTAQLKKETDKRDDAVRMNIDQKIYTEQNNAELKNLKERYQTASEPEREKINKEVKRNEEKFTASSWYEKGLAKYNEGDLDGAAELYKKAIAADAAYAAPWSSLGWIHRDRHEYDQAIDCFKEAIARYNGFALPYNGIAYAYNAKGDYVMAIEYCKQAIDIDQNYAAPWNNLGFAYEGQNNAAKAIECYNKAIALNSKDATPLSNIGNVYEAMGEHNTALEYFQKAVQLEPNHARANNNLGYGYIRTGDFDKAIEHCSLAAKLDPEYKEAWNGLAIGCNYKKKYLKAIECAKKAVKLDPLYANAWNTLGFAYGGYGNLQKSYEAYKKAAELAPDDETYQKNLAKSRERLGK